MAQAGHATIFRHMMRNFGGCTRLTLVKQDLAAGLSEEYHQSIQTLLSWSRVRDCL